MMHVPDVHLDFCAGCCWYQFAYVQKVLFCLSPFPTSSCIHAPQFMCMLSSTEVHILLNSRARSPDLMCTFSSTHVHVLLNSPSLLPVLLLPIMLLPICTCPEGCCCCCCCVLCCACTPCCCCCCCCCCCGFCICCALPSAPDKR